MHKIVRTEVFAFPGSPLYTPFYMPSAQISFHAITSCICLKKTSATGRFLMGQFVIY
ncbi:MAG: hypothetical protein ACP5UA_05105 [Candidatus Hydrogenedens sp.]